METQAEGRPCSHLKVRSLRRGVLVFEVKLSAEGAENMDGALEIKLEVKDVAQMRMLII